MQFGHDPFTVAVTARWRGDWLLTMMDKVKRGFQRTTCMIREKEWSDLWEVQAVPATGPEEGRGSGGNA